MCDSVHVCVGGGGGGREGLENGQWQVVTSSSGYKDQMFSETPHQHLTIKSVSALTVNSANQCLD